MLLMSCAEGLDDGGDASVIYIAMDLDLCADVGLFGCPSVRVGRREGGAAARS